jgi:hypothetical protein
LDNLLFLAKQSSCPQGGGFDTDFLPRCGAFSHVFYAYPWECVTYFQKLSKAWELAWGEMSMLEFD